MKQNGFTLVEVIVVLAILGLLASLSYFFGVDSLRGYQFHSQKDELLSMLQVARQKAIVNEREVGHGVRLESHKATLFDVPYMSGASGNSELILSGDVSIGAMSLPTEIVFEQLSGNSSSQTFVLQNSAGKALTISVNHEGGIFW